MFDLKVLIPVLLLVIFVALYLAKKSGFTQPRIKTGLESSSDSSNNIDIEAEVALLNQQQGLPAS